MPIEPHVPTVHATVAVIGFLTALLMARTLRPDVAPFVIPWTGFAVLLGVGSAVFSMRDVLPASVVVLAANGSHILAVGLLCVGMRRFRGEPVSTWLATLPLVLWIAVYAVPGFPESLRARVVASGLVLGLLLLAAAREAWLTYLHSRLRGSSELALICAAISAIAFWRAATGIAGPSPQPSPLAALAVGVIGVAIPFLGLAIARERSAQLAALREAEAQREGWIQVERLLAGLPAVVFLREVAADGSVSTLYRGGDLEAVTGWPPARLPAEKNWSDLAVPGTLPFAEWVRILLERGNDTREWGMRRPDGAVCWIRTEARVLSRHPDGRVEYVGYHLNITARREAETAAINAARLASLGEVSATLIHDMKQPLAGISLAADTAEILLRQGKVDAVSGKLERIGEQARRAAEVIDGLRRFARGPEHGQPLRTVSLREVADKALAVVGGGLRTAGVNVELDLGEPPLAVQGDVVALQQVIVNLLVNARDALEANPPGAPRLVRLSASRDPGASFVRMQVSDTGGGLPPEVLSRLFQPFVSTKDVERGTGLGLSICRRLVEAIGGSITARNGPEGAIFELTLPCR